MSTDERSTGPGSRHRASYRNRGALAPVRRIVTGFDAAGRATIQSDGVPPRVYTMPGNGPTIYEVWSTRQGPARLGGEPDGQPDGIPTLAPSGNRTRIRVLDFLPEGRDGAASSGQPPLPVSGSIDYCIVLLGEMTLIYDGTATAVRTGDIVVQRGTQHAWVNRSGRLCRVAFILVDAAFDDELSG